MRTLSRALSTLGLVGAFSLVSNAASAADGLTLPLDTIKSGSIKIDGVLKDWPAALLPLEKKVSGSSSGGADLTARGAVGIDDQFIYVAMDVLDDKLVRTKSYGANEDHGSLVLAFPDDSGGYTTVELELFAGDPGNVAGAVKIKGGSAISGASIVEAPQQGGLTFEAKIPWSAIAPAAKVRCGLRGALRYHDADGGSIKAVVGTAPDAAAGSLPFAQIQAEHSLFDSFAQEKGLTGGPRIDKAIDVAGDGLRERVIVWDQYLFVLGSNFRNGTEFYFSDLGVPASMIPSLEMRDVTGEGKADVVVRKRVASSSGWREVLEVLSMSGEQFATVFQHEVGINNGSGTLANSVKISGGGKNGSSVFEIGVGTADSSVTQAAFKEQPETAFDGALLPWGTIKSQSYEYDGAKFAKTKEEKQAAGGSAPSSGSSSSSSAKAMPKAPEPPRAPTADEMLDSVLDLFKKDRKIPSGQKPRFDIASNVAGDGQVERVLTYGKDLVVFGKGFLGGTRYVSMGLGFSDPKDVVDVTARDLTGDGRAEILVRGIQRMPAPKEVGKGNLEREVMLVYSVQGDKLVRLLATELAIDIGDKRINGTIGFLRGNGSIDLELGPGRAIGFDEKSWPFKQESDASSNGGIEPMVLPWSSGRVRLKWNGSAFVR